MILLLATSMMLASPASSLETYTFDPSALNEICSGSVPLVSIVETFRDAMSTMPMPSDFRSGGGSLLSSVPGGAIGDPLSATKSFVPSGLTLMPRGRLPSGMVATTWFVPPSIIVKSPPISFVTYTW